MNGRWIFPSDDMPCTGELGFDRAKLDIPEYEGRLFPINYQFDTALTSAGSA
jgi:hypothetical protein